MKRPPPDHPDRDSMLDLPLRTEDRPSEPAMGDERPVRDPLRGARPTPAPRPPARRARRRRPWIWLALLLVALLGLAYWMLWPKPPQAGFSQKPFTLGNVRVGQASDPATLTVTNIGERPMPISLVALNGGEVDEFILVEDGCGARQLDPQANCPIQVRFAPQGLGVRRTSLVLTAQMPDSPARLEVRGVGTAPVLSVEPLDASFDPLEVGKQSEPLDIVAANRGTAPLEVQRVALGGAAERDFRLTRNECSKSTLEPGEGCDLRLIFIPRAAGIRRAEVVVESNALEPVSKIEISGEGVWTGLAFAVEPMTLDFGDHLVGGRRSSQTLQVINRDSSLLRRIRIALTDADRGFRVVNEECSNDELAPGEGCKVVVEFSPRSEGERSTTLEISARDVGTLGVDVYGRGVTPRWRLSANVLEFGEVRVDRAGPSLPLRLRNDGSAGAKVIKSELAGADVAGFNITADRCSGRDVAPATDCGLQVGFVPRREGEHRADLLLRLSAGSTPQRISLWGRAVAPRLSLDREMVDFAQVHRTTESRVNLQLTNRGTAALELRSIAIAGDRNADFRLLSGSCLGSRSLPAGQQCSVSVGFSPSGEGRSTARLEIEHDGISGPREVPLAGVGLPPPIPELILDESSVDFGPQPVGNRSAIQTVQVSAAGSGSLELREFTLEGADAGDFHIVPATCHAAPVLQPGSTCAIGLRFIPSMAGSRSARLVLRHNAGAGRSTVELRGEGVGGPPG